LFKKLLKETDMFGILLTAATAAYLSRRVDLYLGDKEAGFGVQWLNIRSDVSAACSFVGGVMVWALMAINRAASWTVASGRATRNYVNNVLNPWVLLVFGVELPFVPAIATPKQARALLDAGVRDLEDALKVRLSA
jgi:hypothetical protein